MNQEKPREIKDVVRELFNRTPYPKLFLRAVLILISIILLMCMGSILSYSLYRTLDLRGEAFELLLTVCKWAILILLAEFCFVRKA